MVSTATAFNAATAMYREGKAAGIRQGLEQAAKWHDEQADSYRDRANRRYDAGKGHDARSLDMAEEHRLAAAALRVLAENPEPQPTTVAPYHRLNSVV